MAGTAKKHSARGARSPRRRFERRYQNALEAHFPCSDEPGLAVASGPWSPGALGRDLDPRRRVDPHGGAARAVPGRRLEVRRHRCLPARVVDGVPTSPGGTASGAAARRRRSAAGRRAAEDARRRGRARQVDDETGGGRGDAAGDDGDLRWGGRNGRPLPRPNPRARPPLRSAGDDAASRRPAAARPERRRRRHRRPARAPRVARTVRARRDPPGDRRRAQRRARRAFARCPPDRVAKQGAWRPDHRSPPRSAPSSESIESCSMP